MRRYLRSRSSVVALLVLAYLTWIAPTFSAPQTPQAVVEQATNNTLTALRANVATLKQHPHQIYDLVDQYVLPQFDFDLISRLVLAQSWRTATPDQRTAFTNAFRNLLVKTYANTMLQYVDWKVTFPAQPAPAPGDKNASVTAVATPPSGDPINITSSLRLINGQWKVYDVSVNNVSVVINYRSTFASEIRDKGLAAVIADLQQQAAQKS